MFSIFNSSQHNWIDEGKDPQFNLSIEQIKDNIKNSKYTIQELNHARLYTQDSLNTKRYIRGPLLQEIREFFNQDKTKEVLLSQTHINDGEPKDSDCCPIALAIKEHFDDSLPSVGITISFTEYTAEKDPVTLTYAVSHSIARFISAFDRGNPVQPGTLHFGENYVWFVKEGQISPYETMA